MVVQFFISEVFAGCFPCPGENRLGVGVEMSVFQHIAVQFISLFVQMINQAKDDFLGVFSGQLGLQAGYNLLLQKIEAGVAH